MSSAAQHDPAPARRLPQQGRSAAKIDAIVSATALLLADTQPSELTARTIAIESGVSPATVYRYFRDVDHVVDAVLVEHADAATAAVTEALSASRHRTVAGVFQLVIDTHLRLYSDRPHLTVGWASEELARRRRQIETESDRSMAKQVGRHLVDKGLIVRLTTTEERLLDAHWATAGTLLGIALESDAAGQRALHEELRRLVQHFAGRYAKPVST